MMEDVHLDLAEMAGAPEIGADQEETAPEEEREVEREAQRDLVAAFFADVAQVGLLSRQDEETLGLAIAERRGRILKLLRGRPRLVADALQDVGRGLVHPEEDFREREALTVLTHTRQRLKAMSRRHDA